MSFALTHPAWPLYLDLDGPILTIRFILPNAYFCSQSELTRAAARPSVPKSVLREETWIHHCTLRKLADLWQRAKNQNSSPI